MIIYKIIGCSNIGEKIQNYIDNDERFIQEDKTPDIVFLVGSKEATNFLI